MKTRVVGPQGSWVRRWGILLSLVIAVGMGMVLVKTVLAVHDTGAFELDGNATSLTASPPGGPADDWDRVCYEVAVTPVAQGGFGLTAAQATAKCGASTATTGARATAWIEEPNRSSSIFTGGGSKDPLDISRWAWKDAGGLPDKDNLEHAYAVRYSLPPNATTCPSNGAATCDVIYFGSDRFDNSGDAQQGFWFLQNSITLGSNPVGGGSGFASSNAPEFHRTGDLLIISDFSNGGGTSTITAYTWDPTCTAAGGTCGDANLRLVANLTGDAAKCGANGASDKACGVVNPGTITMPWSFTDKTPTPNNGALNGEFFEAGINLSLLNLSGECFATVVSETRSSTSTSAVLKDLVVGHFGACTSGLTTTPKAGDGTAIPADGLSIGTGSVTAKDSAELVVSGSTTWAGTLKFFLCGPADLTGGLCPTGGTQIGSTKNITNTTTQPIVSDAAQVTSVGNYCWRGVFTSSTSGVPDSSDASAGECFTVNPVRPAVPTEASAAIQLGGQVHDDVNLSGTASKPGSPVVSGPLGAPAGGTLTFRLYGPTDGTCTATPVFTSAAVAVSGDGLYHSGDFTPTQVGTYHWIVSYTGDSPNTLGNAGLCGASNESVVVTDITSATSAQNWLPNDSATITSTGGTALNGSVVFTLHSGLDCTGTTLYTEPTFTLASASSPATRVTTNASTKVSATADVSWKMVFTSTDTNVSGTTKCENTSLTINNNPFP